MDVVCLKKDEKTASLKTKELKGSLRAIALGGERSLTYGATLDKCEQACHDIDLNEECFYGHTCRVNSYLLYKGCR